MTLLCAAPGTVVQVQTDGRASLLHPSGAAGEDDAERSLSELVRSAESTAAAETPSMPGCDACVAALIRDDPSVAPHHRPYPAPEPAGGVQVVELLVGAAPLGEAALGELAELPPGVRLEVIVATPPLPDLAVVCADLPHHRTWVRVDLRRETWTELGATLQACDALGLPAEVHLVQDPPRARLDHLPPEVLQEVVTSLQREGRSLLPRLSASAPTWERTLARLQHAYGQAVARDTEPAQLPDLALAAIFPAARPDGAWTRADADRAMAAAGDAPQVGGWFRCDLQDHITWSTPTVLGMPGGRCVGRSFFDLGVELERVLGVGRAGEVRRTVAPTHLSWLVRYPTFPRNMVVEAVTVAERAADGALVGTYTHAVARRATGGAPDSKGTT